jgi:hypothetical protein
MKRVLPVLALSLAVFALTPVFSASAAPTVVVRPGHLAGWIPTSHGATSYGRWDTGPNPAPLGQGSLHLRGPSKDTLQKNLPSPVNLSGFKATFHIYGNGFARLWLRAPSGATLSLTPDSVNTWRTVNATSSADWQRDCDGNGTTDGHGTIADFMSACSSSTIDAFGFSAVAGTNWVDAATLGASGDVKVYNFEPPKAAMGNAQVVEGNSGSRPMRFVVRLSGRNQDTVKIRFDTSGPTTVFGRACPCEDFAFSIAVLTIPAGHATGAITIEVYGDTRKEPTERFSVRLSTHLNCVPTRVVGVGTIVNDD